VRANERLGKTGKERKGREGKGRKGVTNRQANLPEFPIVLWVKYWPWM
jgi:hypothetical protein